MLVSELGARSAFVGGCVGKCWFLSPAAPTRDHLAGKAGFADPRHVGTSLTSHRVLTVQEYQEVPWHV